VQTGNINLPKVFLILRQVMNIRGGHVWGQLSTMALVPSVDAVSGSGFDNIPVLHSVHGGREVAT
jgi:hypothetical protein